MAQDNRDIIVIGGSRGAVPALRQLCTELPTDLPATLFIVVHIGRQGRDLLAEILNARSPLPVVTATDGAPIERGTIYVAPADRHLLIWKNRIRLGSGPRENMSRPSVDPTLRSAALQYGPRVIGVVITGMLNDGAAGLACVQQCGGITMVQNPTDAEAADMPWSALESVQVDYTASIADMAEQLAALSREHAGPTRPVPFGTALEVQIALGGVATTQTIAAIADPATFACPSCGGVLSEIKHKPPLRFRCQIGHAYTAVALETQQESATDEALRTALRIIEERATLVERMAEDVRAGARLRECGMNERASFVSTQMSSARL